MKTKVLLFALMLCMYATGFAQIEQTIKEMAESEHQKFVNELPNALANGRANIFGSAIERKQFFLEDDLNTFTEFLGWDKKKFSHSTLNNVFIALSEKTKSNKKNPNPVTVTIDFPAQPAETVVSLRIDTKGTTANYTVTTKANVTVEAQKKGVRASIAKNNVALSWEGKLPLVNGEINKLKKITPPVLRFIKITDVTDSPESSASKGSSQISETKKQQMQAMAKELIEKYYTSLQTPVNQNAVLAPEIPNKTEFAQWLQSSTRIEIASGDVSVNLPDNDQFIEVKTVPRVLLHVDPTPYMTEGSSLYASKSAYHHLTLIFTVDLQAEKIAKVVYTDDFIRPVLAPKIEKPVEDQITQSKSAPLPVDPKKQPPVSPNGINYKIQILALDFYKPVAELPQRLRIDGLVVEKYASGYKYVVAAGETLQEALAKQRQLTAQGLDETWIVVYNNEARTNPFEGKPLEIN